MSVLLLRSAILYLLVIIGVRFMGKRQIGELQPSEFVVAMLISEFASMPITDGSVPLLNGVIPIITLVSLEVIFSYLALKNCVIRDFVTGRPSIIIHNGTINQKEMEKLRLNMDDLIKELRLKNILDIQDVRYAILETNGQLSVFTHPPLQQVTCTDVKAKPRDNPLPFIIISGGKLNRYNMTMLEKDDRWLQQQLKKHRLKSYRQVLYMSCDEQDHVITIPMNQKGTSS
jgi:uncharacterized membrane protein YcaP (DUF421 family)